MDMYNFPKLLKSFVPDEAVKELRELRKIDVKWKEQESIFCDFEEFELSENHNRYTICYENVPFECLYLPDENKKMYVMLSGGGQKWKKKISFVYEMEISKSIKRKYTMY